MTIYLIQQIRLVHALTESVYSISVPTSEESKLEEIINRFRVPLSKHDCSSLDISSHMNVSHTEPLTSIGKIVRPLIFPHSITRYCYQLWADKRKYRYSFQGLITDKRRKLLEQWIESKLNRQVSLPNKKNTLFKIKRNIFSRIGLDTTKKRKIGELLLWESDRGRIFPIKAWDDEYFRTLGNSQFVLCPSGDCDWSYRFFESILCGAMPIVEKDCAAYNGFRFLSFDDNVAELRWSAQDAEYNYKLCVEKLTVPNSQLNDELASILKQCH